LAMAFLRDPDGFSQAAGILLCGGAQLGYPAHSETAEYNLLCDPEAASVILSCGVPVSVLPRETAAEAAAGLSRPEGGRWRALLDRDGGQGLLGAVGAAVAAEPSLIAESFACNLSVDTSGQPGGVELPAGAAAGG
ncbi:nucleoside hydrolase, partial [Bittarella massiliensis (ex Durand et al. 2017)]